MFMDCLGKAACKRECSLVEYEVKRERMGQLTGFNLLIVCPWTSHLTSLGLSFLISDTELVRPISLLYGKSSSRVSEVE